MESTGLPLVAGESNSELDDKLYSSPSEDSFDSLTSHSTTCTSMSRQSESSTIDEELEEEKRIMTFYEGLGWKQLVFVQHNSYWCFAVLVGIILHYFILVYGYHFTNNEDKIFFRRKLGMPFLIVIEFMYAVDTAMSIIYRSWTRLYIVSEHPPRPIAQLVCDVLALVPVEYVYWYVSPDTPTKTRVNMYYCLTSHSLIRMYRVFTFFYNIRHKLAERNVWMRLIELLTYFILLTHAFSAVFFILFCINKDEVCYSETDDWTKRFRHGKFTQDFEWYLASFYIMVNKLTAKGFSLYPVGIVSKLIFMLVLLTAFILINGFMMGHFVSAQIQELSKLFSFAHRLQLMKRKLAELKTSTKLQWDTISYYHVLWKNRGGVHQRQLRYGLLPNILHRDLNLDIFGDAFKRSHLFRNANESFLSFLSLQMKAEFYMPGDILYTKGIQKERMIYIVTGVIQILSDEDEESPIISFSGGTCLGEASLMTHCISSVVVKCSSYCEVQVLERKDFHAVLKKYPNFYKTFKKSIEERLNKSKLLSAVGRKGLNPTDAIQLNDINEDAVKWLKNFVQSSLAVLRKRKNVNQSVLKFTDINSDVHRTVTYLDLYVFTEQLELTTDSVCLRTKCPWILQPNSMVIHTWNNMCVFTTVIAAIVLPYYTFYEREEPPVFTVFMYAVRILFVMDVMVQISTAIKTKKKLIAEWKQIFYVRISELGFIADVFAAFPLEIMEYMLLSRGINDVRNCFMLNKLVKLWKVEQFFRRLEGNRLNMTYFIRELKHLLYVAYVIYVFGGLFYFQSCFRRGCITPGWYNYFHANLNPNANTGAYTNFVVSTLYSAILVVGNSYATVVPITARDFAFVIFAMLSTSILVVYIFSTTAAMEILSTKDWSLFQDTYRSITTYMKENKIDGTLQRRVIDYLDFSWTYDKAYSLNGRSPMYDLTPVLQERIHGTTLGPFFLKIPFFKYADPSFISHLARMCKTVFLHPNEVVTYSGEPATCAYIIMNGYCQTFSKISKNDSFGVIGPNSVFNVVEMYIQVPNINTVRTITCCYMIQLELSTFLAVLKKYPSSQNTYKNLIESCSEWKYLPEFNWECYEKDVFTNIETEDMKHSWFTFRPPRSDNVRCQKEDEYMKPFEVWRYLYFMRIFLLRRTMAPNGWFIIGWEISRAVFAFISSILFPAAGALEVYTFPWVIYIRYALDVTAFVDIYMRLHVAFFDERGIVVTHPSATSKHYLTHGFLVDLLAVFPFEILTLGRDNYTLYYYLLFNRILQIHRMIRAVKYFQRYSNIARDCPVLLNAAFFFVFGIIVCNAWGGLLVLLRCNYTLANTLPNKFGMGIYCESWEYMVKTFKFEEPLSPVRVYLYSVYFTTGLITRCGLAGTAIVDNDNAMTVVFISVCGLWLLKYLYARSIAVRYSDDVKTTTHQEKMKSILNFIKSKKISNQLKQDVINYFELIWERKIGKEAFSTFTNFHLTLKEDIFLQVYGENLLECPVFASANRAFVCNLIINCNVEIFLKGSTILRPYETTSTIYFINKGNVDLIVAGNVKACPPLTVGCMFGNLPNALNYNDSLTVIAHGHVDLMAISSKVFHELMALYPKVQKTFNAALDKSPSDFYLTGIINPDKETSEALQGQRSKNYIPSAFAIRVAKLIGNNAYYPGSTFVKVMQTIQLITSYISFFTVTYSFLIGVERIEFYVFLLATDLVFYSRIYMNFKLAYYDEFGFLVTDPATITQRYLSIHTIFGFIYDIVAVFPTDIFFILSPSQITYLRFLDYLRVNRVLTSVYVIRWFVQRIRKLNANVFLERYALMAILFTMMLQTTIFFFIVIRCFAEVNCGLPTTVTLSFPVLFNNTVFIVISIFTGGCLSSQELMPNSPIFIMYCIFIMIIVDIVVAMFIGEACTIIDSSNRTMTQYTEQAQNLLKFYVMNDLSPPLQTTLWSYVSMLWRINRGIQVPQLLKEAPYYIREDIKTSLYGEYVQANPIFNECHDDFLRQLITRIKQYTFFPGNYVTFAGDVDDSMYFVYSGEVEFFPNVEKHEDEDIKGVLYEGDAFGMAQGVFSRREHKFNYRARTVTVLMILNRTVWANMLISFPAVKNEIYTQAAMLAFAIDHSTY